MGQHKIQTIDLSEKDTADKKKGSKKASKAPKTPDKVLVETEEEKDQEEKISAAKKPRQKKTRSKRYQNARGMVDKTKTYKLEDAVRLLQKTSYAKFSSSITADIIVKDQKHQAELTFPHSTGKTKKIAIVTDSLLKKIEKNDIDFDILISSPDFMPKLAKHAKILGPKGLMPNPKAGTITNKPQDKKKELEGGKITIKTEKKAPLMHIVIGKTNMKEKELETNVSTLIKALNAKRILKFVLSSTMSPGIKVDLSDFQKEKQL